MGTITVKSLVDDRLDRLLFDATQMQWDRDARVMMLSDAQRAVAVLRPDAYPVTQTLLLAAGTHQALPPSGIRMGRVTRNMGTDGQTPGRQIDETPKSVMDIYPQWQLADESGEITNWIPDPLDPKIYYVYPPAAAGTYVEVIYPALPDDLDVSDWDNATITLADEYAPALIEYVLFRSYDQLNKVEYAGKASTHLSRFAMMLGVTTAQAQGAV